MITKGILELIDITIGICFLTGVINVLGINPLESVVSGWQALGESLGASETVEIVAPDQ